MPLVLRLLPRELGEPHRPLEVGIAEVDELVQLLVLAVGQGVHRVDDDGLDALPGTVPKDEIDDGDDVREALARSGPGGQNVAVPRAGRFDGVQLVPVQLERSRRLPAHLALDRKDLPAFLVKQPPRHYVRDGRARLKGGIQLDERVRPKSAFPELALHRLADPPVADVDEAPNVRGVVVDELFPKIEYIHSPFALSYCNGNRFRRGRFRLVPLGRSAADPTPPIWARNLSKSRLR